jgi:hypothetical protein
MKNLKQNLISYVSIPRLFRVFSAPVRVLRGLTNVIKKSIIWKGGTVFLVSVLKRFRTFTKTPTISSSLKKHGFLARKDSRMKTFFASTRGRFATTLALVMALVACGGGGGGSTPAPTPTPTPTGTLAVAPATCTIQTSLGKCTATATFATANATTASLTNAGGAVLSSSLSGSQVVDVFIGTNTYTLSANGGGAVATATATGVCAVGTASNGTICVSPVTATLSATSPIVNGAKSTLTWGYTGDAPTGCTMSSNWSNDGSLSGTGLSDALTANATFTYSCTNANGTTTATANVTLCAVGETVVGGVCTAPVVTHTCTAPSVWTASINACLYPVGAQVIGMNQLSSASLLIGDTAWQQAVTDGTIKFMDTGLVMTSYTARLPVFAFFKSRLGNSCARLVYKDDGSAVGQNNTTEGDCNTGPSTDWAVGTLSGVIRHFTGINACYRYTWNQNLLALDDTVISCPF